MSSPQKKHIEQVALTHIHEGHSGMAAWLQRQMNIFQEKTAKKLAVPGGGCEHKGKPSRAF